MRIDLHTHTQCLKTGDGKKREITPEAYIEKMRNCGVGFCSITNHNKFDVNEYNKVVELGEGIVVIPGIELDIKLEDGQNRQVIVVCDPGITEEFSSAYDGDPNRNYNTFSFSYKEFINRTNQLPKDKIIIIPHFYDKANGFRPNERSDLESGLAGYVLIMETANTLSMGIVNHRINRLCLIGSDVKDWDNYSASMTPEVKFSIDSFGKFYELAKDPKMFVKNALDGSSSLNVKTDAGIVSIYDDINIVFGEKGSGKTILMEDYIMPAFAASGKKCFLHKGSDYQRYYDQIINSYAEREKINEDILREIKEDIQKILNYRESPVRDFIKEYKSANQSKITNARAKRVLKADCSFTDLNSHKMQAIMDACEENMDKVDKVVALNKTTKITSRDKDSLMKELSLLKRDIMSEAKDTLAKQYSDKFTERFIVSIKDSLKKCTGSKPKPTNIGLSKLFASRLERLEANSRLVENMKQIQSESAFPIGYLPGKGDVTLGVEVVCLSQRDKHRKDSVFDKNRIVFNRGVVKKIENFNVTKFSNINEYFKVAEQGVDVNKFITDIIKKRESIRIKGDDNYKPSEGERAILSVSAALENPEYDCYLFDEIERGLGHKYIVNHLLPQIKNIRELGKTIVISTHDANIAVNTLPSQVVYCNYPDDETYYCGNMYSGELVGASKGKMEDWFKVAITHLEGGEEMFNSRKNVYGDR
ncbi:MAG: hypothetical protein Q4F02_00480 [Candidatus Saccharibacteria bacterium]|nr:hypothetical protein [Candidatus Saccharibacteria bacterium]